MALAAILRAGGGRPGGGRTGCRYALPGDCEPDDDEDEDADEAGSASDCTKLPEPESSDQMAILIFVAMFGTVLYFATHSLYSPLAHVVVDHVLHPNLVDDPSPRIPLPPPTTPAPPK